MRKIKHFAGYGCVMAEKIEKTEHSIHIRVTGNHERGLRPYCNDTAYEWLVPRFDKTAPKYYDPRTMGMHYEEGFTETQNTYGNYTEQCDFTFYY